MSKQEQRETQGQALPLCPVLPSFPRPGLENPEDLVTRAVHSGPTRTPVSTSPSWNGLVLTKVTLHFQLQGSKWEFRSRDCTRQSRAIWQIYWSGLGLLRKLSFRKHLLHASQHAKAFRFVTTFHTFQPLFNPLGTLLLSPLFKWGKWDPTRIVIKFL